MQERKDVCIGKRCYAFVHRVVTDERDGGTQRDEDKGPFDHIQGDELWAEGQRVVGTMDLEDVLVCVWGTKELHHRGKKDGLDMFVGIENVDAGDKVVILDGGKVLFPGRR